MKKLYIFFLIFNIFILNLYSQELVLTQNEKDFIKKHKQITLAGGENFEPFFVENEDGSIDGYDAEILKIIEEKTGLKIKVELGVWKDITKRARNREYDGICSASITQDRKKYYNFTMPYIKLTDIVIVKKGSDIKSVDDLSTKTVGIQNGNLYYTKKAKALKNVNIKYYNSQIDLINALVSNKVDFLLLDESAFYIANNAGLGNFLDTAFSLGDNLYIHFGLRNDYPELVSIFNKALKSISEKQKNDIRHKWFDLDNKRINIHHEISKNVDFSKEEKEYLRAKSKIRLCGDPNWLPYTYTEDGKNIGIAADIYKIIQSRIHIPIEFVPTNTWVEALDLLEKRECDVSNFAIDTPKRREYLNFTDTLVKVPLVFVTKVDVAFIYDIRDIMDKDVAIPKGFAYIEILKNDYPNLNIIEVETIKDGLQRVKEGKIFAYIGALPPVSNMLKRDYTGELKITGKLDRTFDMGSGVRNDDLILLDILNKAIRSIPEHQMHTIINKWISIKYEVGYDYKILWKIILVILIIAFVILYRQNNLKKLNKKLKDKTLELENAKKDLMHSEIKFKKLAAHDSLTSLYNRRKFDELFEKRWSSAVNNHNSIAVAMIDIDYFKLYNDTYGHKQGDKALVQVAKEIQNSLHRPNDVVARYGGEEFIVLVSDIDEKGFTHILNNICKNIQNLKITHESSTVLNFVTISVGGVIGYPKNSSSAKEYLIGSDKFLYEAKSKGRNQVAISSIDS